MFHGGTFTSNSAGRSSQSRQSSARSISDWRALTWLATETGWARRKRSVIRIGKLISVHMIPYDVNRRYGICTRLWLIYSTMTAGFPSILSMKFLFLWRRSARPVICDDGRRCEVDVCPSGTAAAMWSLAVFCLAWIVRRSSSRSHAGRTQAVGDDTTQRAQYGLSVV